MEKFGRLGEHMRLLQDELIDLENQVRIMGEKIEQKEIELVLGEIDCCKGILYSLVGINMRVVERLSTNGFQAIGRSLVS